MSHDHHARNHASILAFLDAFHTGGTPDFAHLASFFAEAGTYQPLMPATPKIAGRAAIAAALESSTGPIASAAARSMRRRRWAASSSPSAPTM